MKRGKKLKDLLQKLKIKKNLPNDFLKFTDNKDEVTYFSKSQEVNLTYLEKEYELLINTIPNGGPECDDMDDYQYRYNLAISMVEEIEKVHAENILVVFHGDHMHDVFHFDPPNLYSKEEVKVIFKSENGMLIQSLIKNGIVKALEFSREELHVLKQNLIIPISEIVEPADKEFDMCYYYPFYYKIFGLDYIKILLDYDVSVIYTRNHPSYYFLDDKKKIEILKKKYDGTLNELYSGNKIKLSIFCSTLRIIYYFFGSEDLIEFLDKTESFNILFNLSEYGFLEKLALKKISVSVLKELNSDIEFSQLAAKRVHEKLMVLLKSYIISDQRLESNTLKLITFILKPYIEENQLSMTDPTIFSIPQDILSELMNRFNFRKLNLYFTEIYRNKKNDNPN